MKIQIESALPVRAQDVILAPSVLTRQWNFDKPNWLTRQVYDPYYGTFDLASTTGPGFSFIGALNNKYATILPPNSAVKTTTMPVVYHNRTDIKSVASRGKQRSDGRMVFTTYNPYSRSRDLGFFYPEFLVRARGLPVVSEYEQANLSVYYGSRLTVVFPKLACLWFSRTGESAEPSYPGISVPEGVPFADGWRVRSTVPDDHDPRIVDAVNGLVSGVSRTMPVLRSTLELRDTPSTLKDFVAFVRWCVTSRRLHDPIRAAAKAYLWYKFGVEPTYQDVSRVCKEYRDISLKMTWQPDVIEDHLTQSRRWVIDDLSELDRSVENLDRGLTYSYSEYETNTFRKIIFDTGLRWRERVFRGYRYTGSVFARVTSRRFNHKVLKNLVFNSPLASTAWELTPMSFVLDWFIDIGSAIRRSEQSLLAYLTDCRASDVWITSRTEAVVDVRVNLVDADFSTRLPYGKVVTTQNLWVNPQLRAQCHYTSGWVRAFVPISDERRRLSDAGLRGTLSLERLCGLPNAGQAASLLALILSFGK